LLTCLIRVYFYISTYIDYSKNCVYMTTKSEGKSQDKRTERSNAAVSSLLGKSVREKYEDIINRKLPSEFGIREKIKDNKEFIFVDMGGFGVTRATSNNPILSTVGLSGCIGVVLYDPVQKIAGLLHADLIPSPK